MHSEDLRIDIGLSLAHADMTAVQSTGENQREPDHPPPDAETQQALSVQQHEGLQPLGDVPAVHQAVFDDGARR